MPSGMPLGQVATELGQFGLDPGSVLKSGASASAHLGSRSRPAGSCLGAAPINQAIRADVTFPLPC